MNVKIKKTHPLAKTPKQATEFAGGWDVFATEIIKEHCNFVIVKLGFSLEPPKNYKVTLVPRSSITKTNWVLQNSPGLGDPDYTGEYQYRFRCIPIRLNLSDEFVFDEFPYKIGDRIGQIYLEEIIPIEFEEVKELSTSDRNTGGYGSTGK